MIKDKRYIYENMRIEHLDKFQVSTIIDSFSEMSFGVFVWDYDNNICYVNQNMVKRFGIDVQKVNSLNDYLKSKLDEHYIEKFYDLITQIKLDEKYQDAEFPVKSNTSIKWFKLQLNYNKSNNISMGVITMQGESKMLDLEHEIHSNIHKSTLYQLGVPLSVVTLDNRIEFCTFDILPVNKRMYQLIEKVYNGKALKFEKGEDIRIIESNNLTTNFRVKYILRDIVREESIVRSIITHNKKNYLLYQHRHLTDPSTEQERLRKILRANELMMETKDIVEHIDDLNDMFMFLLSKIQTVIPEANRSCILKLDHEDMLYLHSSYGFNDEYIDGFKIPFKQSFAYIHMQKDYSKSVIINDIQQKYGDLFPDIKNDSTKKSLCSNMTVPLVINNKLYGLISVDSNQNRVFDDVDLNLLDYMKTQTERAIEKYRSYRDIKKDSTQDSLTGVSNRRHLQDVLQSFKEKCINENTKFRFVVFDIDKLKTINDTLGHNCGDKVIQQFAFVIQSNIRDTDFFARIGGDEFVGLFYDVDTEIIEDRIHEWKKFFSLNPIEYKGNQVEVKFSYGVSTYPDQGLYFSELMEKADLKLYIQKNEKKKNV